MECIEGRYDTSSKSFKHSLSLYLVVRVVLEKYRPLASEILTLPPTTFEILEFHECIIQLPIQAISTWCFYSFTDEQTTVLDPPKSGSLEAPFEGLN
jgi:hypothetical protein